ncbi:MAG TPA: heparinase II/III family protein [Gemmatimonadales bacterium]|nr:heparinase II/III family protein [Gemmatimonadales bacterium]
MLTADALAARQAEIAGSPDLAALYARLAERARPVLDRMPTIPEHKALLSMDGGVCPRDGSTLTFDPWAAGRHRCPRCGEYYAGERHERWWARFQHLWLAERMAHLAAVAAFAPDESADASSSATAEAAAARARELLAAYGERYLIYPNRDNVLGPARLFFSTYLESIWLTNYLAAAVLLRESALLDETTEQLVSQLADEAANLIGDFDEGASNRQTWHNAALAAIAVWFEDEELLARAVEGPTGLLAHLLSGFGADGMWFEGENYHLFALRGLLTGFSWARAAGVDPFAEPELAARLTAALRAPALTALPDLTFPARKDSRFGVSLAQPMYLELWEAGLAGLIGAERDTAGLADWLAALYAAPAPAAELFDSYLHEAGQPAPESRSRADLSWWMLLAAAPALDGAAERWQAGSALLEPQGLAVLRAPARYASLECGAYGGGHGHPDRLNISLHADGVYWLPDFGTGSYVSPDLAWYRSTLAHNAPLLDGRSQAPGDAVCEFFDADGEWTWVRGRFGDVSRSIIGGPDYLLDVVELASEGEHTLQLPWHPTGEAEVRSPGVWEPAELEGAERAGGHASRVERFRPAGPAPIVLHAVVPVGASLTLTLAHDGELFRGVAPGAPGTGEAPFYVARARGKSARIVSVLTPAAAGAGGSPPAVRVAGEAIEIETSAGVDRHHLVLEGWNIDGPGASVRLRGRRPTERSLPSLLPREEPFRQRGVATRIAEPPPLDGTTDGFEADEPLLLDHEDQYRRSEEPFAGADELSAIAEACWDDEALYLAVAVTKPDLCLRPADAPALRFDNEADDIHSDGLQVYLRLEPDGPVFGWLVVPETSGELRVRAVPGTGAAGEMLSGAWAEGEGGYTVTLALRPPGWDTRVAGDAIDFDLLVNEMLPDRERRAGQLVWSGGGGWVYLRGDRQDPARFGRLELA